MTQTCGAMHECKCVALASGQIMFCPEHAAAPKMLAALRVARKEILRGGHPDRYRTLDLIDKVIGESKGRPDTYTTKEGQATVTPQEGK